MNGAPPVTPLEDRFDSASEATSVPSGTLERHRAPGRIDYRRRQSRCRGGLIGTGLEMNPKLGQDIGRVGQHVHRWEIGAPLIVGEIADPVFQQRLGDRWDALTAELRAGTHAELLHVAGKGTFGHRYPASLRTTRRLANPKGRKSNCPQIAVWPPSSQRGAPTGAPTRRAAESRTVTEKETP